MSPLNITQPLDSIRYMVYNGYYKVMSNIPKMGHLPTPEKYPGPSKWFKMLGYAPTHNQSVVYSQKKLCREGLQSQIVAVMAQLTLIKSYKWDDLTPITEIIYGYMSL